MNRYTVRLTSHIVPRRNPNVRHPSPVLCEGASASVPPVCRRERGVTSAALPCPSALPPQAPLRIAAKVGFRAEKRAKSGCWRNTWKAVGPCRPGWTRVVASTPRRWPSVATTSSIRLGPATAAERCMWRCLGRRYPHFAEFTDTLRHLDRDLLPLLMTNANETREGGGDPAERRLLEGRCLLSYKLASPPSSRQRKQPRTFRTCVAPRHPLDKL